MRRFLSIFAALLANTSAFAHEPSIVPATWRQAWSWEPAIAIPIGLSGILYCLGIYRIYAFRNRSRAVRIWEIACFAAGWLSLILALDSPIHRLGEELFSAHMTQHEILMVVAAPLLVLGRPLIVFLFALPASWRPTATQWTKQPVVRRIWQFLTGALTVWILHALAIWIWHIPSLYEATLDNEFVHALQHICFLGTALLFWWTLIHGSYGRIGYGIAFLYLFTTAIHTSILGFLMTFARGVWYPIYSGRTAPWHLTPLQDQQLGGLIMWIPSGTVFIVVGLAIFAAWIGESERRGKLSQLDALIEPAETNHAA